MVHLRLARCPASEGPERVGEAHPAPSSESERAQQCQHKYRPGQWRFQRYTRSGGRGADPDMHPPHKSNHVPEAPPASSCSWKACSASNVTKTPSPSAFSLHLVNAGRATEARTCRVAPQRTSALQ
ncbi:uncharacterized protein PV09_01807 [Verruconis gallopava]|uniref:Uncharacterized protein n=1 Tax=Verruconis gallopava TaxID=253628 RepID=A0A0D1XYN0_9PEZI|nr:uncharacterized protein PV09_01807 [Verruconis gallopava]KIW07896.1 hypothetical protein PV09_01807 [Verruconis gallopava]